MRQIRSLFLACCVIAPIGCHSKPTPQATQTEGESVEVAIVRASTTRRLGPSPPKTPCLQKLSGRLTEVMQADGGPVKAIEVCSQEANEIATGCQ